MIEQLGRSDRVGVGAAVRHPKVGGLFIVLLQINFKMKANRNIPSKVSRAKVRHSPAQVLMGRANSCTNHALSSQMNHSFCVPGTKHGPFVTYEYVTGRMMKYCRYAISQNYNLLDGIIYKRYLTKIFCIQEY